MQAYELSTLTGTQVLLLVVSETGLVYTFTTAKLQPLVTQPEGKNLIQACLNAPHGQLPSSMPVGTPLGRSANPMGVGSPHTPSAPAPPNVPGGLAIGGKDGRSKKQLPFQTNGRYWWLDVAVEDLGCAGQTVSVNALTTLDGQDGRGLAPPDYEAAVGRKGMGWSGVAAWQLS